MKKTPKQYESIVDTLVIAFYQKLKTLLSVTLIVVIKIKLSCSKFSIITWTSPFPLWSNRNNLINESRVEAFLHF